MYTSIYIRTKIYLDSYRLCKETCIHKVPYTTRGRDVHKLQAYPHTSPVTGISSYLTYISFIPNQSFAPGSTNPLDKNAYLHKLKLTAALR